MNPSETVIRILSNEGLHQAKVFHFTTETERERERQREREREAEAEAETEKSP